MVQKTYRQNGAIGALLDEYEKALRELIEIIRPVTDTELSIILDRETEDDDCRSIQTILTHVIRAGYGYVIEIRKWKGERIDYRENEIYDSVQKYIEALNQMFNYNESLFSDYPGIKLEEYEIQNKMRVKWGQAYDVEQLFEHAIVHILRHRRQIEKFKNILDDRNLTTK